MTPQIGPLLREWRTATGLSLGKLAQKAGVNASALSRWEAGTRQPRVPELEAALYALNASSAQRAQALAAIDAPRTIRRLRQTMEGDALGPPPRATDLLRALRGRKGWTQEQVALQIGVRQSAVTRWENGDRLPSHEQMHALCYALGASEAELVALTTGRFAEIGEDEAGITAEEQENRLERTLEAILSGNAREGLSDLILLTLERKAWTLAMQRESSRYLLARILAHHAEMHRNAERWLDVAPLANRAIQLVRHHSPNRDFVLRAGIMSAAAIVYAGNRLAPNHGIHTLSQWLPHSPLPAYTAWIQSDMAKYAALSGQMTTAVTLAEQSCQTALSANATEMYLRRMDHARLLLQAGRPDAALRAVPDPRMTAGGANGQRQLAQDLLFHAEAHLLSQNVATAQDYLQRGLDIIEAHAIDSIRPKANALTQRL